MAPVSTQMSGTLYLDSHFVEIEENAGIVYLDSHSVEMDDGMDEERTIQVRETQGCREAALPCLLTFPPLGVSDSGGIHL